MDISFHLPVTPMPTPRPRARIITPKGRRPIVSMYSPKEYQSYLQDIASFLASVDAFFFEGPVQCELEFYLPRPKTTKLFAPKPDIDNYVKGVLDALTKHGGFWNDDTQVVSLSATKAWSTDIVGTRVSIRSL